MTPSPIVFLVDVDNTLIDNDRIQNDLKRHLEREFGAACRDRYWTIHEQLFNELGYRDYLGALQRYRVEHPHEPHLVSIASYLVDYPFANRLYPGALDVLERSGRGAGRSFSPTATWCFSRARSNGPASSKRSKGTCSSTFTKRKRSIT